MTVEEAVDEDGCKILVYGGSGSGKTVLCSTTGKSTLIISAERGLKSLVKLSRDFPKRFKKIRIVKVESLADLKAVKKELKRKKICKWIALDSASEIAEQVLEYEKENNRDPRKAYGNMQDEILKLIRQIRDLEGYNVIVTAKQQYLEDSDAGGFKYMPLFPGRKLHQLIPYMFDEVFALRVESEEDSDGNVTEERWLQTGRDSNYDCKDRSGVLDMFEEPNLKLIENKMDNYKRKEKRKKKKRKKSKKSKK